MGLKKIFYRVLGVRHSVFLFPVIMFLMQNPGTPGGNDEDMKKFNLINTEMNDTKIYFCERIDRRETEKFTGLTDFDPVITTKVHIEGELGIPGKGRFWSVEYAIPFSELFGAPNPIPVPGNQWRINLYRIDSPEGKKKRYYAWNPTGKIDFHRPWKFGMLRFD